MKTYAVNEIFASVQGEGGFCGTPTIFVRFSGCNCKCPFCDTDFVQSKMMSAEELAQRIVAKLDGNKIDLITFTGGEPLLQIDKDLVNTIIEKANRNIRFAIETNGTIEYDEFTHGKIDNIVCSPKTFIVKKPHKLTRMDEVKMLCSFKGLSDEQLDFLSNCNRSKIFIQPIEYIGDENKTKTAIEKSVEICLKLGYRLSAQVHKYLNLK